MCEIFSKFFLAVGIGKMHKCNTVLPSRSLWSNEGDSELAGRTGHTQTLTGDSEAERHLLGRQPLHAANGGKGSLGGGSPRKGLGPERARCAWGAGRKKRVLDIRYKLRVTGAMI